jgi:hypothetical protein
MGDLIVYSEENINTENKTFLTYEGNLKIFGSLKLEYQSQIKLYQLQNKVELLGKIEN